MLLNKFKWGHAFLSLNHDIIAIYSKCVTGAEVIAAQDKWLTAAPAYGLAEGEGEEEEDGRGEWHCCSCSLSCGVWEMKRDGMGAGGRWRGEQ